MNTADGQRGKQEAVTKQQIVLVVDGRPVRQFYTSIFLQRLQYHVIMAKTAEDALLFIDLTVPKVIIANVDLPQMSGIDLLKRVKKDRRTRDVPVLIYTSNKYPHVKKACKLAGCAAYLTHPASLDQLYAAVQKAEAKPRRYVRLATALDVIIGDMRESGGPVRDNHITMISELGMFVGTSESLAFGTVHSFTFLLPNAPGWLFRVEGEIVYRHLSKDAKRQPGMGVKFVKIGDQERDLIKDFIREKLMEGIAEDPER